MLILYKNILSTFVIEIREVLNNFLMSKYKISVVFLKFLSSPPMWFKISIGGVEIHCLPKYLLNVNPKR